MLGRTQTYKSITNGLCPERLIAVPPRPAYNEDNLSKNPEGSGVGGFTLSVRKRPQQSVQVRRSGVLTIVIICLLVLSLAYVAASVLMHQGEQMDRVLSRQAEISKELAKAEAAYQETLALYESMGSDAFIEQMAREKLNMLRPGEILFVD